MSTVTDKITVNFASESLGPSITWELWAVDPSTFAKTLTTPQGAAGAGVVEMGGGRYLVYAARPVPFVGGFYKFFDGVSGDVVATQDIGPTTTAPAVTTPTYTPSAPSSPGGVGKTRLDIKQAVRDSLGEEADNPAALSPIGLDALIDRATEDVARETNCLYRRAYTGVVSGQDVYCAPQIYKIKQVLLQTPASPQYPNGQLLLNEPTTPVALDSGYGYAVGGGDDPLELGGGGTSYGWRQGLTSTQGPFAVATEGLNRLRLSPAPGWSDPLDTNGKPTSYSLTVEGYGVPDPWPGDGASFPLPELCFWAVAYKVCLKRLVRWITLDGNSARMQVLRGELADQMAQIEAGVVRHTEGTKYPVYN